MDNDDEPIGRILTRREVLALFGIAGATALAGRGAQVVRSARTSAAAAETLSYLPLVAKPFNAGSPASPTATSLPSATATGVPSATATSLPSATATGVPSATATGAPSATATGAPSATVTGVPSATATGAPSATATGIPSATPTPAPSATATVVAPTATATATQVSVPVCIVRPEQTEGPYFLDNQLNRSDIRVEPSTGEVKPGVLLGLNFAVSEIRSNGCFALAGATVDVWHTDALGVYSGVGTAAGLKFLRGYQVTDGNGQAQFLTIYPGWYQDRTVHIHFKIRAQTASGQTYDFTAQLYFDDALTDQVYLQPPYNTRPNRSTRNNQDGIYANGGSQLLLTLTPNGQGGYTTTFTIGLVLA